MYVVKRPFRNLGMVYTVGSVITEPTEIKRFKGRIAEGKILEVTEQNFEKYARYFTDKYGVDIRPEPKPEPKPDPKPESKPEPIKVATVVTKPIVVTSTSRE